MAGTRCRDLRDAVKPLGLKQEAEAEIAYLSPASGERKESRVLQLNCNAF